MTSEKVVFVLGVVGGIAFIGSALLMLGLVTLTIVTGEPPLGL